MVEPGSVVELRVLGARTPSYQKPHTEYGYYDDLAKLSADAWKLSRHPIATYSTLNPVNPALLARAHNHANIAKKEDTTAG